MAPHQPKAWYHATGNGRFLCRRCRETVSREELDAHTAVCWPEVGQNQSERVSPKRLTKTVKV